MLLQAKEHLALAEAILNVYGVEGDNAGPKAELSTLSQVIAEG